MVNRGSKVANRRNNRNQRNKRGLPSQPRRRCVAAGKLAADLFPRAVPLPSAHRTHRQDVRVALYKMVYKTEGYRPTVMADRSGGTPLRRRKNNGALSTIILIIPSSRMCIRTIGG